MDREVPWNRSADTEETFVAVTANSDKAESYGFVSDNIFPIWDWVGGRFSVSSATSLAVMIAVGPENFKTLLDGVPRWISTLKRRY